MTNRTHFMLGVTKMPFSRHCSRIIDGFHQGRHGWYGGTETYITEINLLKLQIPES